MSNIISSRGGQDSKGEKGSSSHFSSDARWIDTNRLKERVGPR